MCQIFNNLTVVSFKFQYFLSNYHLSHIVIQTVWILNFNCADNVDGRICSCVCSVWAADVFCAEIYVAVQWIMKISRYGSHTISTVHDCSYGWLTTTECLTRIELIRWCSWSLSRMLWAKENKSEWKITLKIHVTVAHHQRQMRCIYRELVGY